MGRKLLILNERDMRHPRAGGAELHIAEIGKRLVQRGYELTLLCTRFPGAPAEEVLDGIRVRRFGNRMTYYLALPFVVRRELGAPGTLIIEHLNKLPFCAPLYARAPVLVVTHHLFGWTAFRQVPAVVAAVVVAAERLVPYVYRGQRFIAVSPSTRDDLIRRGISAGLITIIPNGVDHQRYCPGEARSPLPTILGLGRIEPYKHFRLVLKALQAVAAEVPDVRLQIVGSGGALDSLKREATRLGVAAHVEFTGFVSEEEKLTRLQRAHVLVNVSEKEGWGLTIVEAAACGTPAVASDVEGLRDAVIHNATGMLVPHGDVGALSRGLIGLLRDHARREHLGERARRWALRFRWDQVATETAGVIEAVAERRPLPEVTPWFGSDTMVTATRLPMNALAGGRRG